MFDSPQVKRYVASSIVNRVYEFPHNLPNDLRLHDLRKLKMKKYI